MKTIFPLVRSFTWFAAVLILAGAAGAQTGPSQGAGHNQTQAIALDQLGAVAGKQYDGDGLSVVAIPGGARLRCVFQRLEGEATAKGLWLSSTAGEAANERFRVVATAVGREVLECGSPLPLWNTPRSAESGGGQPHSRTLARCNPRLHGSGHQAIAATGTVSLQDELFRFIRPCLTEEYSVSVDGVRQDFIVGERPPGAGPLRVGLEVTGARVEPLRPTERCWY